MPAIYSRPHPPSCQPDPKLGLSARPLTSCHRKNRPELYIFGVPLLAPPSRGTGVFGHFGGPKEGRITSKNTVRRSAGSKNSKRQEQARMYVLPACKLNRAHRRPLGTLQLRPGCACSPCCAARAGAALAVWVPLAVRPSVLLLEWALWSRALGGIHVLR